MGYRIFFYRYFVSTGHGVILHPFTLSMTRLFHIIQPVVCSFLDIPDGFLKPASFYL